MDAKIRPLLEKALQRVEDPEARGPRLLDDATRLWARARKFLQMQLLPADIQVDTDALELACYALQLPLRHARSLTVGKLGRTNLRERAEHAAEMLVSALGSSADEQLLDRATRMLLEVPQRSPAIDEARVLADAVNLEDFGVLGLLGQAIQLARGAAGIAQIIDGAEKREAYGYWDARLREGFHFDAIRKLARQRLEHLRKTIALLSQELQDDLPS